MKIRQKQGRSIYGVDMKIVDGNGKELPWDGKTYGDLLVRGPLILDTYYKGESPLIQDAQGRGWFPTGDVATIDPDGFMQITDRSKDVIKSGGEWISSIDIENIAMGHPAIAMAACIGMPHPKWDERPIVAVTLKPGAEVTREELLHFYEGKTAKWQIPDDVVFVDAIPLGATGKRLKNEICYQGCSCFRNPGERWRRFCSKRRNRQDCLARPAVRPDGGRGNEPAQELPVHRRGVQQEERCRREVRDHRHRQQAQSPGNLQRAALGHGPGCTLCGAGQRLRSCAGHHRRAGKAQRPQPRQGSDVPELRRGGSGPDQQQVQLLALPPGCRHVHEDGSTDHLHEGPS